jgi:hypothetical protein
VSLRRDKVLDIVEVECGEGSESNSSVSNFRKEVVCESDFSANSVLRRRESTKRAEIRNTSETLIFSIADISKYFLAPKTP